MMSEHFPYWFSVFNRKKWQFRKEKVQIASVAVLAGCGQ